MSLPISFNMSHHFNTHMRGIHSVGNPNSRTCWPSTIFSMLSPLTTSRLSTPRWIFQLQPRQVHEGWQTSFTLHKSIVSTSILTPLLRVNVSEARSHLEKCLFNLKSLHLHPLWSTPLSQEDFQQVYCWLSSPCEVSDGLSCICWDLLFKSLS